MIKKILVIAPYLISASVLLLADVAVAESGNICYLDQTITTILEDEKYEQAQWGIAVQDLVQNELVYAHNANTLFVPASNAKLFTTAAALEKLQLDHQFITSVYAVSDAPNLDTLVIRGGGDPSFDSQDLEELVRTLKSKQILSINQLILDDSLFAESAIHPTWEWSDLAFYYAPPVNSLILDENAVVISLTPSTIGQPANLQALHGRNDEAIAMSQWQIDNQLITSEVGTEYQGSITQAFGTNKLTIKGQIPLDAKADIWGLAVPNPTQNFLNQLLADLSETGIQVATSEITYQAWTEYENASVLTFDVSPILSEILSTTNQDSNNIYAESLRHFLGSLDSEKNGSEMIAQTLSQLGVSESSFVIKDGSGLSRHNLATPESFTQLLDVMADHPDGVVFQNSLAIAGESGTLSRRFVDSPIAGNFYGKTGTMTNVVTLSGYLNPDGDRPLAISILVNQSPQSARVTRQGIDTIVEHIYQWNEHCF